jgi:hypothetical protein
MRWRRAKSREAEEREAADREAAERDRRAHQDPREEQKDLVGAASVSVLQDPAPLRSHSPVPAARLRNGVGRPIRCPRV